MKKSFILSLVSLLVFVLQTGAQTDKTGTVVENQQGELLQSDPLNGKQYYKAIPFSMKKGEAVLFTMKSSAFKPHILMGTNIAIMAMGQINEYGTESKVTFLAPADTAFFVIFTSMEENKTGKFSYGYSLLKAEQVTAINNAKKNPIDRFTTGNLGKQLLELLDHSKNGFKAIRGEKTKTEKKKDLQSSVSVSGDVTMVEVTSLINHYKSSYSLENARQNSIIETFPNEKNTDRSQIKFEAIYGEDFTKAEGEELYEKFSNVLKQKFADGFKIEEKDFGGSPNAYDKFVNVTQKVGTLDFHHITLHIHYWDLVGARVSISVD